ncbi:hypothetical protein C8R44DRAFT_749230 [Mycena epipterygia]|nr:hypothetical protein C8R44DRAFT_749230 [Mycena epipterygia]
MSQRPPAGTTLTTSTLLSHENGGGAPGEDKILIGWAVRETKTPKSINPDQGTSAKKWAVSVLLPDIKSHLVKTVNVEWGRSNSVPLEPDEVTFRWHGGILLEPNTANMLLGQFYTFYSTPSCASIYLSTVPASWKSMSKSNKGPTIWLELYIDSAAYKHCLAILKAKSEGVASSSMDSMMTSALSSSVRKRALSSTSEGSNRDEANKCSNISGVMKSMFVPSSSGIVKVHKYTSVTLNPVICVTDSITVISGTTRDVHFSEGAMTHAYDFKTSSTVAIAFADAWLGKEIGQPSKASEMSRIDEAHEDMWTQIDWLNWYRAYTIGTPAHQNRHNLLVLFDPMTHTPAGDSGIGDFGPKGIQSFIRDHKCGDVCRSLGLHESVVLENEAPEKPPQQATPDSPDSQRSQ